MNDEEANSDINSGEEDHDALIFHIIITEPLSKLKYLIYFLMFTLLQRNKFQEID